MAEKNSVETLPILHRGICPSCKQQSEFDLIGIQSWPKAVAKVAGFSELQTVWHCRKCDTTLMEPSLQLNQPA